MGRLVFAVSLALNLAVLASAQEVFTPTVPEVKASITSWTPRHVCLMWEDQRVEMSVIANTGEVRQKVYHAGTTPTGLAMMRSLNTANLTSNSLWKRTLERLRDDGVLTAGAVTGTP